MNERTALYRLFDEAGELLYVGITGKPQDRWNTHRCDHAWWSLVASKRLEWFDERVEAAKAEAISVRTESPRFNKALPDEDGLGGFKLVKPRAAVSAPEKYRQVRMGDMWNRFGEAVTKAEPELDRSKMIREFIRWYIGDTDRLPKRPALSSDIDACPFAD